MVVLVVLVLLVAASARPAFEAGESRGGEERGPLTGYFYFSAAAPTPTIVNIILFHIWRKKTLK